MCTMEVCLFLSDYARLTHPFAPKNMDLRGHIGNVFASDRQRWGVGGETCQSIVVEENNEANDVQSGDSNQEDDD
jgi:hypothetical protein